MKVILTIVQFAYLLFLAGCNGKAIESTQPREKPIQLITEPTLDSIPKAIGWINDFEHLFLEKEIDSLSSIISRFERATSIEIAIATLDSSLSSISEFDNYTLMLANSWSIGKKEENNGILIAISAQLRRIRIQNGSGIVNFFSDKEAKHIIDKEFVPSFKKGEYFEGTLKGLNAIIKLLEQKN